MSRGILRLERAVLESLSFKEKNIDALESDLGIDRETLLNILSYFIMEGVILYKAGIYKLQRDSCLAWCEKHDSNQGRVQEILEIVESALQDKFSGEGSLIFRKLWMEQEDKVLYERMIQNFEIFMHYLEEKQKDKKLYENNELSNQVIVLNLSSSYKRALTS